MAKHHDVRCDHCGATHALQNAFSPLPDNFYTLQRTPSKFERKETARMDKEAADSGDYEAAWAADAVLEKYFCSVDCLHKWSTPLPKKMNLEARG